jgi:tRNA(Ile)-lysidine synthase
MAMLTALSVLVPKERLFCLHIEHGIRSPEESLGDAEFVRDFCEKRGIKCRVESVPHGKIASFARRRGTGIEAAARFFRRRALIKEARRRGQKVFILTAHTKDDMLETVLMRVLRGAGPQGLSAMPVKAGQFIRPLLSMSRADVIDYLKEKNVSWREDSTNKEQKFLRNKVRHTLVPLLNESFPDWKKGLSAMAETQSLAAEFLNGKAKKRITWEEKAGDLVTDAENFFVQNKIIRETSLFHGIDLLSSLRLRKKYRFRSVKRSVVRRFCEGFMKSSHLGPLELKKKDGKVVLSAKKKDFSERGFSLLIKEPGLYNLNNIAIEVRPTGDGHVFFVTIKDPVAGGFDV